MSGDLSGKVALVCGMEHEALLRASSISLAERGARVLIAGPDEAEGAETVYQIRERGLAGDLARVDLSQSKEVRRLFQKIDRTLRRLDIAHNHFARDPGSASVEAVRLSADWDEADFEERVEQRLRTAWLLFGHQIRAMEKRRAGAIVTTLSARAFGGSSGYALDAAFEHGVVGLTQAAARECSSSGVRLNTVCTPWSLGSGSPALIDATVNTILWLNSRGGALVSGQMVSIDGGMTAF
jgi:NAD(P)-dependent dehydrogenase (short-subunit alcohol dehydrogenase family)